MISFENLKDCMDAYYNVTKELRWITREEVRLKSERDNCIDNAHRMLGVQRGTYMSDAVMDALEKHDCGSVLHLLGEQKRRQSTYL